MKQIRKSLAVVLAMLTLFSSMAVISSAEGTKLAAPTAYYNEEHTAILVEKVIVGETATVTYIIEPGTGVVGGWTADSSKYQFANLKSNTAYKISYTVEIGGVISTSEVTVVKPIKENPPTPVPSNVTSTGIVVNAITGAKFRCYKKGADAEEIAKAEWTSERTFLNLTPEIEYIVEAMYPETDTYAASGVSSVTVKTLKKGKGAPEQPKFVGKTDKTITVEEVNGVEFTINDGKSWQKSGVFAGLEADKAYRIEARYTFDASVQDAGERSEALLVATNARAAYVATAGNSTIKITIPTDGLHAKEKLEFTVTGDGPANMSAVVYGDTRYVPVYFTTSESSSKCNFEGGDGKTTNKITAHKNVKGVYYPQSSHDEFVITVYLQKQVYKGQIQDGTNVFQNWVDEGDPVKIDSAKVKIGKEVTTLTKIADALSSALSFLFDTLPKMLMEVFGKVDMDAVWKVIMSLLNGLGKSESF